jgi:hypothetical protein
LKDGIKDGIGDGKIHHRRKGDGDDDGLFSTFASSGNFDGGI